MPYRIRDPLSYTFISLTAVRELISLRTAFFYLKTTVLAMNAMQLFLFSFCLISTLATAPAATPRRLAWTSYPEHIVIPSVEEHKKEGKPAKKHTKKAQKPVAKKAATRPATPPAPTVAEPSEEEVEDFFRFISGFAELADQNWDAFDDDPTFSILDSNGI